MNVTLDRSQRDELARRHVESAEIWLRRIAHELLSQKFGESFHAEPDVLPRKVKDWIGSQLSSHSGRFKRAIDATSFDQLVDIVTHPKLWSECFSGCLGSAYPNGNSEARTFLGRLRDIRNDIAHGRGCSSRRLEQAICYSNDLIESLLYYYKERGVSREYDVPLFTRFVDNLGNESHLEDLSLDMSMRVIDLRRSGNGNLRPGDILVAEVEADTSFDRANYKISHSAFPALGEEGSILTLHITNAHVAEQFMIQFELKTDRDWHRQHGLDDRLIILYRVLPPV